MMIHDIEPLVFHNEYRNFEADSDSLLICIINDKILMGQEDGQAIFPHYGELDLPDGEYYYLFSIAGQKYFLYMSSLYMSSVEEKFADGKIEEKFADNKYEFWPVGQFREVKPRHTAFAMVTAHHISRWYGDNRFCGRCRHRMELDLKERMVRCPECGNLVYPRISPAVIVGVVDHERILLTRYAGREYNRYALVAGFAEIGESLEQTVAREVMEEVGLRVKNIRYYKSQPWSFSGTLLSGFFADLDGSGEIILDEEELSEAVWFGREEVPIGDDGISLTREMIRAFCDNTWC